MNNKSKTLLIVGGLVIAVIVGFILISNNNDRRSGTGQCNDNYSGSCVPNVKNDIDCKAVGSSVTVTGKDVYHFDADGDGSGCESYN